MTLQELNDQYVAVMSQIGLSYLAIEEHKLKLKAFKRLKKDLEAKNQALLKEQAAGPKAVPTVYESEALNVTGAD
jgi:hypothetical protein